MDHRRRRRCNTLPVPAGVLLLGLGAGVLACASPHEEEDYDFVGEHIGLVIENDDRELCAGNVWHLDRYVERAFEFFDVTAVPENSLIAVHVVVDAPCPSTACYRPDEHTVFVEDIDWDGARPGQVLRHELAHAVIDSTWGQSAAFFNEGLAESFSRTITRSFLGPPPAPEAVGAMLGSPSLEIDYTAAAYFTRFLIDTRGLARFKQLFLGARGLTGAEIQDLMALVYGESFEAIETEYLSGEPRCQYQLDLCDPMIAESVTYAWYASVPASCSDPYFYGSRGTEDLTIGSQQTIRIEESGTFRLMSYFDWPPLSPELLSDARILLHRCGDCDQQFVEPFFDNYMQDLELEAGLYTFEILMPFETVVTLEVQRLPDAP